MLPPSDANGTKILPKLKEAGYCEFIWRPDAFECVFKPRSEGVEEMITREAERAEVELKSVIAN